MKFVVPTLAAAFFAAVGVSGAQAAVIDFGVDALAGSDLSYTSTSTIDKSTAFDFDGSPLIVVSKGPGDASGLTTFPGAFDTVSLSPTDIVYDMGTLASDVVKSWTGSNGDMFTETLTDVSSINRSTADAITVVLTGTVTDSDGVFKDSPVKFIMQANQVGGPGSAITASFTNVSSSVPEPATWVMLGLGFAALGYAAVRRNGKDKAAIAI